MKGEEQLTNLLKLTREQVRSKSPPGDWFDQIVEQSNPPDDGSPQAKWNELETSGRKYVDNQDETYLWAMVATLYELSRWYLDRPVSCINGIGETRAESLENMEVFSVRDLITHYPRAYTDRRFVDDIRDAEDGQYVSVYGEVLSGGVVRGRKPRYEVRLNDDTGTLRINFWNQTYLKDKITRGKQLFCSGEVEDYRGTKQMNNPDYELIESEDNLDDSKGIKPIYPLTEGIYLKQLRSWIQQGLDRFSELLVDCLPARVRNMYDLVSYQKGLRWIHAPDTVDELLAAKRRLIFNEFFYYQILFVLQARNIDRTRKTREYPRQNWQNRFVGNLPFTMTDDQENALNEIESEITSNSPMHRLLQGDVGTGKTVVALASMLRVVDNGYQTAIMAPTEVLAQQHYRTFQSLLSEIPCRVDLLIGGLKDSSKKSIINQIRDDESDIIVGTHALFQDRVDFSRLGYVVIDEQHRFGVDQRRKLRDKGPDVDMLVMSATPIPRSMALTRYGDLRISTLETFPHGPKKIETEVFDGTSDNRRHVYRKVRNALDQETRAFFVFPAIEENEELDIPSAEESFERAKNSKFFDGIKLGLIHGRMDRQEKDRRIKKFSKGEVQLLFTTTVIEVGIDVPEASFLVVHGAERFGLAQLHQLRGRIGRAGQQARCYLLIDPDASDESRDRLEVLEETQDGFEVSRADLKRRGMGDLAGTRQAGFQPFELGNVWDHESLMKEAREASEDVVSNSDGLEVASYILINKRLDQDYSEAREYIGVG